MAQLDGSFYLQSQGPDIGQSFERGMRLGDMMKQRKIQDMELQKQQQIKDAYQSGVITNPDGTQSFNSEMTLGALMKVDPKAAFEFKQQQAANLKSDLESQYAKNSMISSLLDTVKDQDSYLNAKAYAISKGIKEAEQMPNTYDPQIINSLRAQYQKASLTPLQQIEDQRKREEAQARLAELQDRRLERRDANMVKAAEKQDKKNAAVTEIQDRYLNINNEISNLKTMLDKTGTFEIFGPENEIMDQKITSIATDMAKLVDPTSVARESEVAAFKKMLFQPTLWMQNSSAKGVLDSFKKMVDDRLSTAYKVRGLDQNQAVIEKTQGAQKPQPTQQDIQAFEWAQQYPNDPRAAKIIEGLKARGF